MTDTKQLLRAYVRENSEAAFRELVSSYVNLVYSTASRLVDDNAHAAQDITQTVFIQLANKAKTLPEDIQLGGWLYRTTCFTASTTRRGEQRRIAREQKAVEMNTLHDDSDHSWRQLAPLLDDALTQLDSEDRDAIVLRFFEQRNFRSVGLALGLSEDTAQKRVSRALEKLRSRFAEQSVALTITLLVTMLTSRSVSAAPAAVAGAVADAAFLKGSAASVLSTAILKFVFGGLAVASLVAFIAFQSGFFGHAERPGLATPSGSVSRVATRNNSSDESTNAGLGLVTNETKSSDGSDLTNFLQLEIFAGNSERRLANVPVEIWCEAKKWTWKTNVSDRLGNLRVPLPDHVRLLRLTTRLENFADTRLLWEPAHGEVIPAHYQLHLASPAKIGGRAEDENGKPVADAVVSFNHGDDVTSNQRPENHEFDVVHAKTDANGHWEINRIALEMIPRLDGAASHSNYVRAIYSEHDAAARKRLLGQQYVFRLGAGRFVRGIVIDEEDRPVSGATVFVSSLADVNRRNGISLEDGSFSIRGCLPGKTMVTAAAPGLAATTIWSELRDQDMPLRLRLERPKTFRCRVVNDDKEPLAKVCVMLYTLGWQFISHNDTAAPPPQVEFSALTDADGRLLWTNAPSGFLEFRFDKYAYEMRERVAIAADGEEHEIILHKVKSRLVINGTARDERGAPVPKFRIFLGWPQPDPTLKTNIPVWSSLERHWLTFANGSFKFEATEPLIQMKDNPGYILKIEAEGYANYVSRVFAADEGPVRLDVILRSSPTRDIAVVLPNGQPAVNADVGFISAKSSLRIVPGKGIELGINPTFSTTGAIFHTDAKGEFKWRADDEVQRVMVVHPDGFADVIPDQLDTTQAIQLLRWGRLEGVCLSAGKPVEGREFKVQFTSQDSRAVSLDQIRRGRTDAEGKFVIEPLPPGKLRLVQLVGSGLNGRSSPLEIQSGETTSIRLGENGYTVQARVRYPNGFQPDAKTFWGAVRTPVPAELTERMKHPQPGRPDPEVVAYYRGSQHFMLFQNADGLLSAEDVPAGTFELLVQIKDKDGLSFSSSTSVTIPADPPTGTVNAGEMELVPEAQPSAAK